MRTAVIEKVYQRHIRPLSRSERLQLIAMTAQDLAERAAGAVGEPRRSVMELHGLGAEIWRGVDPDEYVDELRSEWDDHP